MLIHLSLFGTNRKEKLTSNILGHNYPKRTAIDWSRDRLDTLYDTASVG